MGSRFIDTNIFIEVFVRKGSKSDRSKKLLKERKDLMTTSLVVSEVEWVLRSAYLLDRQDISKYIQVILSSGIMIEDGRTLVDALNYYRDNFVDWTDCLNMFRLKEEKVEEAYSYDEGLKKYEWIKRLEP